jgi:hypothetical protein
MTRQPTTLVTVVFEGDALMLRLQARSIARYAQALPDTKIIVIENFRSRRSAAWRDRQRALYGSFAPNVSFVAAGDLIGKTRAEGWWKQQLLKLAIARRVETDTFLVLDGKSLLIRDLRHADIFAADGKPKMPVTGYAAHPLEWFFDKAVNYFALDRESLIGRFVETTPPFTIDTGICRDLIAEIERREGSAFEAAFLSTGVTEFFLYGAYILSRRQSLEAVYAIADPNCQTIWAHEASLAGSRAKIETARSEDNAFFAVHRRALGAMDLATIAMLADHIHQLGLDAPDDTALNALTQTAKRGRREQTAMDIKKRIHWRLESIRNKFRRRTASLTASTAS